MYTADGETFTVFLMTSLTDDGPIAFHMREGTNDQWDFTEFIISLVDSGKVVSGDYLIMDNCSIHAAEETGAIIFSLLDVAGVHLIFLPSYSPELNPCELVFAQVKNHLCNNRGVAAWDREILFAFSLVSLTDVYLMYMQCIWMDFLDPPKY